MNDEGCLTLAQVCRRLQISRPTVIRMIDSGEFDGVAFRVASVWRFDREPLELWIQREKAALTAPKVA